MTDGVQVSTVCDGSPYYAINAPNVSPTAASSSQIVFNDTDRNVSNQRTCNDFAQALQQIIGDLKQHGYTDLELPAFPKSELLRIMGKNKIKKDLRGQQLDEYLKSKLIRDELVGEITPPSASCNFTLDSLVSLLQNGNALLNSMKAKTQHSSLNYGLWLNVTYQCFEFSKGAGLVEGTWSNWLIKMLE